MADPDPEEREDFGRTLATLRTVRRWTQEKLAAEAGISSNALSNHEQGNATPHRQTLEQLAGLFGLTVPWLDLLTLLFSTLRSLMEAGAPPLTGEALAADEAEATRAGRTVEGFLCAALPLVRAGFEILARGEPLREAPPPEADADPLQALWALLEPYRLDQQRAAVEEVEEFHSWPLCRFLCETSEGMASDCADRAVELADLACRIAERLPGEEGCRASRRGFAGCHLGNALRAHGDLPAGESAFAGALDLLRAGDPTALSRQDQARLLDLQASLLLAQRHLPEALTLLDRALDLNQGGVRTGRILVKKAKTLEELGDPEAALATLLLAAPLVEAEGDPRQRLTVRFNRLVNLCDLRRHEEAEALLPEVQTVTLQLGNDLDGVRLRWLEGRIAAGLGRMEEGIRLLAEVRERFVARKIAYDTGLVTLELAALLAELGRTAEVKALARETETIFKAQQVERERLGALRLFCQAAMKEKLTAGLARQLLVELRKAQA